MLAQGLPESQVVNLWNTLIDSGADLVTDAGEPFSLISPGRLNDSHGADICGAVLVSSRGKRCGDIEFHVLAGDWYCHGHHRDPAYRKVILHVVLSNDRSPILNPVDEIPTISLYRYLNESVRRSLKLGEPGIPFRVPCYEAGTRNPEKTGVFLEAAGEARFQEKVVRFLQVLQYREAGQVLYSGIMEALGYTKNKAPFVELADRVPLRSLEALVRRRVSRSARLAGLQALLMGTAGLLPSQRPERPVENCHSGGVRSVVKKATPLRPLIKLSSSLPSPSIVYPDLSGGEDQGEGEHSKYPEFSEASGGLINKTIIAKPDRVDSSGSSRNGYGGEGVLVCAHDDFAVIIENSWQTVDRSDTMTVRNWDLYKVRPANSPVRRLAAMTYLLIRCGREGLFNTVMEEFKRTPSGQGRLLVDGMQVASDGYWLDHYEFGLPSPIPVSGLIGSDRASEIIVNVLLPFMYALGSIKTDIKLMDKSRDLYRTLPAGEGNSIERHMIGRLGLHKGSTGTTVKRQGLIHVYKNFCVQGKCGECCMGHSGLRSGIQIK